MKSIKLKIVTLVTVVGMTLTGCTLDTEFPSTATPDTYLKTQEDVNHVVTGLYGSLFQLSYAGQLQWLFISMSDMFVGNFQFPEKKNLLSSHGTIEYVWRDCYNTIKNANNLMRDIPDIPMTEENRKRVIGSIQFTKGFAYFTLVRLYGGVPIRSEIIESNSEFNSPRSPIDSVYAEIFSNFENAAKNLPTKSTMETMATTQKYPALNFHANRFTALAALAQSSLTYANYLDKNSRNMEAQTYYQNAATYADSIISNSEYSLMIDYAGIYDYQKREAAKQEVMLKATFVGDVSNEGFGMASICIPANSGTIFSASHNGSIRLQAWYVDQFYSDPVFFQNVQNHDYRLDANFITRWTIFGGVNNGLMSVAFPDSGGQTALLNVNKNVKMYAVTSGATDAYPYLGIYRDPNGMTTWNRQSGDFPLLRVGEMYLIKAEALNELGYSVEEAFGPINVIRQRARNAGKAAGTNGALPFDVTALNFANFMSSETNRKFAMRMMILRERDLELAGENRRYYDLQRMLYKDGRTMFEYQFNDYFRNLPANQRAPLSGSQNATTGEITWGQGRIFSKYLSLNADGSLQFPSQEFKKFLLMPIPDIEVKMNASIGYANQNPGW